MSFKKHEKNGIIFYTSSLFDDYLIPHFFAAKHGGKSSGDFFSLNISTNRKDRNGNTDSILNVKENLSLGLALLGADHKSACMMQQIHSANIEKADIPCADVLCGREKAQDCDGIFTTDAEKIDTLCVKTADCVPVLLYDTKNDVAMALHAGWRGTVGKICSVGVEKLRELNADAHIIAAIGPCILDCCYEVSSVVYDAAMRCVDDMNALSNNVESIDPLTDNGRKRELLSEKIEKCFTKKYFVGGEQKYRVSLSALNRLFLENAGVAPEDIDEADLCTCCHTNCGDSIFFSHRASKGFSGTQMSVVKLRS